MSRLFAALTGALLAASLLTGCDPNPQVTPTGVTTSVVTSAPAPTTDPTTETTTVAPTTTTVAPPPPVTTAHAVAPAPVAPAPVDPPAAADCGADQYRNVDGVCVDRPRAAPSPPAGATARCNDGTYSFSKHHQGTCSGHGGVAEWL